MSESTICVAGEKSLPVEALPVRFVREKLIGYPDKKKCTKIDGYYCITLEIVFFNRKRPS